MLNNQTVEKLRDLKLKVMANMLSNPDAPVYRPDKTGMAVRMCRNMHFKR